MPSRPESVLIRDVAECAGVSQSTVSLALRNSPRVKEATRRRVQQVADELGYCPNPLVAALMRARRSRHKPDLRPNLALITSHDSPDGWKISHTLRQFHEVALRRVAERGFHLESIWFGEPGMNAHRLNSILHARGVRGLLLFPFAKPSQSLDLDWSGFATVAIGFSIATHAFDRVANDHFHAMRTAVSECYRLGYRRIAFASLEHMCLRVDGRWTAGYLGALHDLPAIDRPRMLIERDWNLSRIEEWFSSEQPDVIIASEHQVFADWCAASRRRIPRDLGLASLSVESPGGPQSGIFQNPHLQAERAVDLLIDLIMRNQFGLADAPMNCLIEGSWVPGSTLARLS